MFGKIYAIYLLVIHYQKKSYMEDHDDVFHILSVEDQDLGHVAA